MARLSPDITENLLPLLCGGRRVLDVGCGDASLLKLLTGHGLQLFGVDPALEQATSLLQESSSGQEEITLLPAAAEALPFEDSFFDTVVLQCVFSLCRPEEAARELCRVLRAGGRLILSDLYTGTRATETVVSGNPLVSRLWSKDHLEAFLSPFFSLSEFRDLTPTLTEMILSAIWNDEPVDCVSCSDLSVLRKAGAQYGLWIWEKH